MKTTTTEQTKEKVYNDEIPLKTSFTDDANNDSEVCRRLRMVGYSTCSKSQFQHYILVLLGKKSVL